MIILLENVYRAAEVVEIEAAGFEVLGGLLQSFVAGIHYKDSKKNKKIQELLPKQFKSTIDDESKPVYDKLLTITDFISGMTDSYAVNLYKIIKGISLP